MLLPAKLLDVKWSLDFPSAKPSCVDVEIDIPLGLGLVFRRPEFLDMWIVDAHWLREAVVGI